MCSSVGFLTNGGHMLSKYTLIVDQYTKIAIFSNIGKLNIIHNSKMAKQDCQTTTRNIYVRQFAAARGQPNR